MPRRYLGEKSKVLLLSSLTVFLFHESATRVDALAASLATSASSVSSTKRVPSRTEWQDELLTLSQPLQPTPLAQALETLTRDGVVRISRDGATAAGAYTASCHALRSRILDACLSDNGGGSADVMVEDKRYVPGTRLRFSEPMDIAFGGDSRHDLLLPLECQGSAPELQPVLRSAASQLEPLLRDAAKALLPRLANIDTNNSQQKKEAGDTQTLEVVEIGSLVVRHGSKHQMFHGDYRRYYQSEDGAEEELMEHTQARIGKVPPRLVSFVALQDVPTIEHGVTAFVTGTNNARAHEFVYGEDGGITVKDTDDDDAIARALEARASILDCSTRGVVTTQGMRAGDMLVYDASVLHWGSANRVAGFDRAILYFGVSNTGAALRCSDPNEEDRMVVSGFERKPPVSLEDALVALDQ